MDIRWLSHSSRMYVGTHTKGCVLCVLSRSCFVCCFFYFYRFYRLAVAPPELRNENGYPCGAFSRLPGLPLPLCVFMQFSWRLPRLASLGIEESCGEWMSTPPHYASKKFVGCCSLSSSLWCFRCGVFQQNKLRPLPAHSVLPTADSSCRHVPTV